MFAELADSAPLLSFLLAVAIGILAAIVNMVAGGGSGLSLGLLIATGMPTQLANGTNRMVILAQSVTGAGALARRGRVPWPASLAALPAAAVGTAAGAWTASVMEEANFRSALGWLFLGLGLLLLWQLLQKGRETTPAAEGPLRLKWWMHPALLAAGFMAGFVQMGVGILVLMILHVAGRVPIVAANAVKIVLAVLFSVVSLAIFAWQGQVDWRAGAGLALGGLIGAVVGVRLMLRLPATAIRWALLVFVLGAAWQLLRGG